MSLLTAVLVLVMLVWLAWFATKGLLYGVRLLRRGSEPQEMVPTPALRDIATVLFVGVGGALLGSVLVVAAWVAEREAEVPPLRNAITQLETKVRTYEAGLVHLERLVEAGAKSGEAKMVRFAEDLQQELAHLRQRAAGSQ